MIHIKLNKSSLLKKNYSYISLRIGNSEYRKVGGRRFSLSISMLTLLCNIFNLFIF